MLIPLDIPQKMHKTFQANYKAITKNSDKLFLFAADHKIEHLQPLVAEELFKFAAQPEIGAFATHLGLIARYGHGHPDISYVVKLNSKTNLLTPRDPVSRQLWSVDDVITFQKNSGLNIRGVGYTVYLGSEFEATMLKEAAQIVFQAHQHGLVAVLWVYPRGKWVENEYATAVTAGAAGVANSLGADFVKLKVPKVAKGESMQQAIELAVQAAGNTKVLFSGGETEKPAVFLKRVREQLNAGSSGAAVGRNIFELEEKEALAMIKNLWKLL